MGQGLVGRGGSTRQRADGAERQITLWISGWVRRQRAGQAGPWYGPACAMGDTGAIDRARTGDDDPSYRLAPRNRMAGPCRSCEPIGNPCCRWAIPGRRVRRDEVRHGVRDGPYPRTRSAPDQPIDRPRGSSSPPERSPRLSGHLLSSHTHCSRPRGSSSPPLHRLSNCPIRTSDFHSGCAQYG